MKTLSVFKIWLRVWKNCGTHWLDIMYCPSLYTRFSLTSVPFWDITQRRVITLYRRFGKNLSVPSSMVKKSSNSSSFGNSWTLKTGPIGYLESSVQNYHSTLCNIPEERRSQSPPYTRGREILATKTQNLNEYTYKKYKKSLLPYLCNITGNKHADISRTHTHIKLGIIC